MAAAMCAVSALSLDRCSTTSAAFASSTSQAPLRGHSAPGARPEAAVPASGVRKCVRIRQPGHHVPSSSTSRNWPRLRPCNSASDDSPTSSSSTSSPPTSSVEGAPRPDSTSPPPLRPQARRQADSTDWVSSSLSRRFGLAGGLAWVGFLAFGVISEQVKTRTEVFRESQETQDLDNAKEITLDNNVKYVDLRSGGGSSPVKGDVVLIDVVGKVRSTGKVFVDTTSPSGRSLGFVYGLKPYPRGLCYGLEYALKSMRAGGKRKVVVPADQCFGNAGEDLGNGVLVPPGEDVEFEVQLERVSIAPS